jgi:hypothetical protein
MCGQFESNHHDNTGVYRQTNQPIIRINPCTINRNSTNNIQSKEEDDQRFNQSFYHPSHIVFCIEYTILLTNKIDFREQTIQIFVSFIFLWQ